MIFCLFPKIDCITYHDSVFDFIHRKSYQIPSVEFRNAPEFTKRSNLLVSRMFCSFDFSLSNIISIFAMLIVSQKNRLIITINSVFTGKSHCSKTFERLRCWHKYLEFARGCYNSELPTNSKHDKINVQSHRFSFN